MADRGDAGLQRIGFVQWGGNWRQHAGVISASGMGNGFGGRMICLDKHARLEPPFDLSVEVRLEDESGAAGLFLDQTDKIATSDFIQPIVLFV